MAFTKTLEVHISLVEINFVNSIDGETPHSGTSSQHHSLNRSLGSHSPQIRILLGITVHPLGMT